MVGTEEAPMGREPAEGSRALCLRPLGKSQLWRSKWKPLLTHLRTGREETVEVARGRT